MTFYDDTTGERMELSAASLGNWVAKTHFLLLDEVGLGPGDRAYVDLPLHWQRLVVWLGAWSAGVEIVTDADGADVAFVSAGHAGSAAAVDDVFALALAPWGRGFDGGPLPPEGTQDFVVAVRPQPDAWGSVRPTAGPDDAGFDGRSRGELMAAGRAVAAELGLPPGARVAMSDTSAGADRPETVLAVLAVAGSMVLTRTAVVPAWAGPDSGATARRDAQERVTHRI